MAPQIFFFNERGYFDQKLPEKSNKNGPDALQIRFELVVYVVKKV